MYLLCLLQKVVDGFGDLETTKSDQIQGMKMRAKHGSENSV